MIKKRQFTYVCSAQSSKSFLAEHRHLQINESSDEASRDSISILS